MKKVLRKKVVVISALCLVAAMLVCGSFILFAKKAPAPIKKDIIFSLIMDGNPDNLKSGDIISITTPTATTKTQEVQYVKVTGISRANEEDIFRLIRESLSITKSSTNPFKISFALCKQQMNSICGINLLSVKISLVCHSNDSKAQELLQKQDSIIRSVSSPTASQGKQAASTSLQIAK